MRRFAWYGRLSTKDKQDPTLSFPSQRRECEAKVAELGGRIVCDFTDQESGRRDDRAGWTELVREAKEREVRRFDAVIIYATSRLSRELFHALSFERELTRVGVEVLYALTSGDQTSPEGRLMRHMFQALDQFEVEKLGREVRRGQTENTRQGYRNGGRAPYGYRLRHEPHPDPARARAGDTKSRLVVSPEQAPVIVEMFSRFLSGSGYAEIADHLNRPGGPPSPRHVDTKRNTSGRWSKSTIRSMLDNPVYTGRLYWNRLDFRAVKQGEGPLVRRGEEEWIAAERRHDAIVSDEDFERVQTEMRARSTGNSGNRRRRAQKRFYPLRGIVHCATGHNPLRMHGKSRKGNNYYACGYRISYGDTAAEANGHGKWQYVREDRMIALADSFMSKRIFGPDRLAHFRRQIAALRAEVGGEEDDERERVAARQGELEQKIERQLDAIEEGIDPILVGDRIRALKTEREEVEAKLAQLDHARTDSQAIDPDEAAEILASVPDLSAALAEADPEARHALYEAFRLRVEIDRNAGQIRLKALISSAFGDIESLSELSGSAPKAIAGAGFERISATVYRLSGVRQLP
jgi:DNA invertase Pin-like site-specific DNA recombinase